MQLNKRTALFVYNGSVRGRLSGGEYVYGEIRTLLKTKFEVHELILDDIVDRLVPDGAPIVKRVVKRLCLTGMVFLSFLLYGRYDLVVTTWTPEVPFCGDVSYIQSHMMKQNPGQVLNHSEIIELYGKRIISPIMRLLARVSLRIQTFAAVSVFCGKNFQNQFTRSVCIIYPPAQVGYSADFTAKENIVLAMGRLSPEKNFEDLSTVGPNVPEAKFVLVGPTGKYGKKTVETIKTNFAKKSLQKQFEYMGWISPEAKNDLMRTAKVFFHPARNDPFPLVVIEAMNFGAIPIVHVSGGSKEAISADYVFQDASDAILKIRQALAVWSPLVAMGLHEQSLGYNLERFRTEFSELIEQVIERKKRARGVRQPKP